MIEQDFVPGSYVRRNHSKEVYRVISPSWDGVETDGGKFQASHLSPYSPERGDMVRVTSKRFVPVSLYDGDLGVLLTEINQLQGQYLVAKLETGVVFTGLKIDEFEPVTNAELKAIPVSVDDEV